MKTIITLEGKYDDCFDMDIDLNWFNDPDTSIIYNAIMQQFPNLDIQDLCLSLITYHVDHVKCIVQAR